MGGCPLSCADADPAHRAVGNVPVHKCITGLVRPVDPELNSRAPYQFKGFECIHSEITEENESHCSHRVDKIDATGKPRIHLTN